MLYLPASRERGRHGGIVLPLVTVSLLGIMGVTAIVLDGGVLQVQLRRCRAAADAAALAAAIDLYCNWTANQGSDPLGLAATSAQSTASDNGMTDGVGGVSVTVNIPPVSGPCAGLPGYAEVIITLQQTRYFSKLFGSGNLTVTARAVARGTKIPRGNGLIVMRPSETTLSNTGAANLVVSNGNIVVNSNEDKGAKISSSGNIQAPEIDFGGKPGYSSPGTGNFIGTLLNNQPPAPDPLANLSPPPVQFPIYNNVNISSLPTLFSGVPGFPTVGDPNGWTLPPGTYSNGLTISDNNPNNTYTLQSGIYYFTSGGLNLIGNCNVQSDSSGVMLYLQSGGSLTINGGASVTLTPMLLGDYKNITVYQNSSNNSQASINGQNGGTVSITGTVYLPAAQLTLTGGGGNYAIGSQVIVYQLNCAGSGTFTVLYNTPQVSPNRDLYLVE